MRDTTLMQQSSRPQHLHTLSGSASVYDAAKIMTEAGVGAVLITSTGKPSGRLVGIFTERDLMSRVVHARRDAETTTLASVMTVNPAAASPTTRVSEALAVMEDGHFRHLPITEGGRLVGIVSMRDLHGLVRLELEDDAREYQAFVFSSGYSASSLVFAGRA